MPVSPRAFSFHLLLTVDRRSTVDRGPWTDFILPQNKAQSLLTFAPLIF
jgi:hypothetical protein